MIIILEFESEFEYVSYCLKIETLFDFSVRNQQDINPNKR